MTDLALTDGAHDREAEKSRCTRRPAVERVHGAAEAAARCSASPALSPVSGVSSSRAASRNPANPTSTIVKDVLTSVSNAADAVIRPGVSRYPRRTVADSAAWTSWYGIASVMPRSQARSTGLLAGRIGETVATGRPRLVISTVSPVSTGLMSSLR